MTKREGIADQHMSDEMLYGVSIKRITPEGVERIGPMDVQQKRSKRVECIEAIARDMAIRAIAPNRPWEACLPSAQCVFDAALAVLMEPDEEMVNVGNEAVYQHSRVIDDSVDFDGEGPKAILQAMLKVVAK
jgi:hypothetical protein